MAAGICGMHYVGMAAMQMMPAIQYDTATFLLSVLIAYLASVAALRIVHALRSEDGQRLAAKRVTASLVMAVAITGMHYTGMAAAEFAPGSICGAAGALNARGLAVFVSLFTLVVLGVTVLLSCLESRFDATRRSLTGSLQKLNLALTRLASTDTLTDLPNRATLIRSLELAIGRARHDGNEFAVLFMDLDGFKTINDSLGHTIGDGILRAFARRLRARVRREDTVARLGGDEFVVLVEGLNSRDGAGRVAQAVVQDMRDDLTFNGHALRVTTSIGIAMYPRDADTVEHLLKNADIAMYSAKQAGRNGFRFYETELGESFKRVLTVQQGLNDALGENQFFLHFQPKFADGGKRLTGAEALIRWNHPQLGLIPPAEFIPVAERSGQIIDIGFWVTRSVCRQLKQWDEQGHAPMKIAINLSTHQLHYPNMVQSMLEIVTEEGIEPGRIMFEITETVAMQDAERCSRIIHAFHAQGFNIAIDDFGTGYSSLAYLQQFRVQQLKIDRFFTAGLDTHGEEGRAIVSAIVALAHSMNMEVVAEGVETATQLSTLGTLACDQVQGFLLEKPMPAEQFERFLRGVLPGGTGVAEAGMGGSAAMSGLAPA
jgi:diguanylate cyclase (GGDEF)-like protein